MVFGQAGVGNLLGELGKVYGGGIRLCLCVRRCGKPSQNLVDAPERVQQGGAAAVAAEDAGVAWHRCGRSHRKSDGGRRQMPCAIRVAARLLASHRLGSCAADVGEPIHNRTGEGKGEDEALIEMDEFEGGGGDAELKLPDPGGEVGGR